MKNLFLTAVLIFFSTNLLFSQEVVNRGRISGYMFGDYFYNVTRDTGISSLANVANGGKQDLNGIQIRRIYFTYDYDISQKFVTRFRLEADQEANTSNGKIGVFVKDAYLQWKNIFNGSDFIFGIQPTPSFEISETFMAERYLEKTIMDLRGFETSRELAVSLKGKLDSKGILKYWLMVGDGSGNKPETDKYKRFYAHLQYSPFSNFTTTLYADLKSRPDIKDPFNPTSSLTNNDLTYAFFAGYKEKNKFMAATEIFLSSRQNDLISDGSVKNKNAFGITLTGSYYFSQQISFLIRYDYFDPNINSNYKGDSRNFFIFSLNYYPDEKVIISPNVVIETYESIPNGRSIDASITPRITFFYSFL